MSRRLRLSCTPRGGERGAALVEIALVLPLFVVLFVGAVQFGTAWLTKLQVEGGARAGARVGSSLSSTRLADYSLLRGVAASLAKVGLDRVEHVVVYKAAGPDGRPPAGCTGSSPASQPGLCNVYSGGMLRTLDPAQFTGTTSCGSTAPDRQWCPVSRQSVLSRGPDFLGVWVKTSTASFTGVFGAAKKVTATSVMRLEPR
ncbi:MAG: TadE/TadG family type IV pilus assembly protein [Actinomycetota bacterium]